MNFLIILTFIIILILIFINGLTDAPNAIATLVGTKVMPFKKAATMSAIFNLIGIFAMCFINTSVADCISSMVDLTNSTLGIVALCTGMSSVIIFALVALNFGIPTSESHGLIAGLTGSAIALSGISSINFNEWKNVIIGLVWSLTGAFILGIIVYFLLNKLIDKLQEKQVEKAQIISACGMSLMHGAQDGLKFIGVLVIFNCLVNNSIIPSTINPIDNILIISICAFVMALGVSVGGHKIVKSIGEDMILLDNSEALCSDIVTIFALLIASLTGLPISTTHAKTVSIISVGKCTKNKMDKQKIFGILKAWIYTFPICGLISYASTMLILKIFM